MTMPSGVRLETVALALQTTALLWFWWRQLQPQSEIADQVQQIQVAKCCIAELMLCHTNVSPFFHRYACRNWSAMPPKRRKLESMSGEVALLQRRLLTDVDFGCID